MITRPFTKSQFEKRQLHCSTKMDLLGTLGCYPPQHPCYFIFSPLRKQQQHFFFTTLLLSSAGCARCAAKRASIPSALCLAISEEQISCGVKATRARTRDEGPHWNFISSRYALQYTCLSLEATESHNVGALTISLLQIFVHHFTPVVVFFFPCNDFLPFADRMCCSPFFIGTLALSFFLCWVFFHSIVFCTRSTPHSSVHLQSLAHFHTFKLLFCTFRLSHDLAILSPGGHWVTAFPYAVHGA